MIQPTQYFQLENIPLFNGAYIILSVEHKISANKMTTSFSGTKLLKYPIPRVLTPVAFTNYNEQSGGEIVRNALTVASQATMITPERLEYLNAELGVDISHHNGNADWKKAKAAGVTVGFIKLTQGTKFYSGNQPKYDITKQVNDAINNDVTIGYYHFAEFGKTSNPVVDGQNQANWFISKLNLFPTKTQKINLPAVLDIEGGDSWQSTYLWNNKNDDLNTFIKSFIDTMSLNNYETMIYSGNYFIKDHGIKNQSNYPLWLPNYMDIRNGNNPETHLPTVPTDWNDWDIWQFSSQGIVDGVPPAGLVDGTDVDLNIVRKEFLQKFA
jgi:lysozyme